MADIYSPTESAGFALSDAGHSLLDIAGFIPGYGEAFDVTNAVWYCNEEKYLDAGLSLISVIPIVGDLIGKGGRSAKYLGPKATKTVLEALQRLDIPKFLDKFRSNQKIAQHIDKIQSALRKWQDELVNKFNASKANKGVVACPYKCKPTSNGAILKPNPNKTTTVLGRFDTDMNRIINDELKTPKNTDFGPKQGGFNMLNVPDEMYKNPTQFWNEVNKPFLDNAIQRGDDILMASDPTAIKNLFKEDGSLTGFGREVEHLIKNGYTYDPITKSMIK